MQWSCYLCILRLWRIKIPKHAQKFIACSCVIMSLTKFEKMNLSVHSFHWFTWKVLLKKRYSFIILTKLWQEFLWLYPPLNRIPHRLINFFSCMFWLVYDKAIHLFLLSCSQIGSSSHDSVPVPFHLLPGEWSLSPFQPRSQGSFLLVPIERKKGQVIMSSGNEVEPVLEIDRCPFLIF